MTKQINFKADPETVAAIEALRRKGTPIPSAGQVIRRAVQELYRREIKPTTKR